MGIKTHDFVDLNQGALRLEYDPATLKGSLKVNDVTLLSGTSSGLDPLPSSRAVVAAAGADAAGATALSAGINAVTGADSAKGVALPAAATTQAPILVINTVNSATLLVYPVSGGNDNINALSEDAAFTLGAGRAAWFIPVSATLWYVEDVAAALPSAAELNYLDIAALGTGAASKAVVLDSNGRYRLPSTGTLFNAGKQTFAQAAPAAKTVTAGITAAELVAGLITTTGATGPSIHQLPTGTEIDAAFPGIATGDAFDFTIINTGTGASDDATITVNTDVTIVGNPTVGSLTDATIISGSGRFRARRTAANTYVVYRLA